MNGDRTAVVVGNETPDWVSCRSIFSNLKSAYQLAFDKKLRFFHCPAIPNMYSVRKLTRDLIEFQPQMIVILDQPPHPLQLLCELRQAYGRRAMPPIFIHIFGDFTLNTPEWMGLSKSLTGTELCFLCASSRQAELISRFLKNGGSGNLQVCPFPIDTAQFYFDPKLREKTRRAFGLHREHKLLLYSGRLSMQKNAIDLARLFLRATSSTDKMTLYFAGGFDDIGAPFFGVSPEPGSYFQEWNEFYQSLLRRDRNRIRYLGVQNASQLLALYNAADIGVSLGLHHDEDFGMAPAEMLCTGSQMLLTDWGGYSSFADAQGICTTLPVKLPTKKQKKVQIFSEADFQTQLAFHCSKSFGVETRQRAAEQANVLYSIESVASKLQEIYKKRPAIFSGFGQTMQHHASLIDFNRSTKAAIFSTGMIKGGFYETIYSAYIGESKK